MKARTDAADAASVNRITFGRTGTERMASAMTSDLDARRLDGHKRETPGVLPEDDGAYPGAISKHSLLIAGHQTSISVEDVFWDALKAEAARRTVSVAALVAEIDEGRGAANLSSAIRVHLFLAREGRADHRTNV